jgi:hypothetical protein
MKRYSVTWNELQLRPDQLRNAERELANAEMFVDLWFACGQAIGRVFRGVKRALHSAAEHGRGKAMVPRPRA